MTKPFTIHIPMLREKGMLDRMNDFYEGILGYERDLELNILRVPNHSNLAICFKYSNFSKGGGRKDKESLYEFFIEKNFPSLCRNLKEKGIEFDMLARTPGFYFARIMDPSGNLIEIISESFEDDLNFDISSWSIHQDVG
ncbi:VOC family protein [Variovorax boronicumulans]|uniref:VOC family protein n=1 Tax=Variovorax boronicumulans TaxID=436515 RepID=UPI0012E471A7|nr:VOC family protein [Variovorax boronicumulans]GER10242.1 VOC family protein [Variovorax boronicumulans]